MNTIAAHSYTEPLKKTSDEIRQNFKRERERERERGGGCLFLFITFFRQIL